MPDWTLHTTTDHTTVSLHGTVTIADAAALRLALLDALAGALPARIDCSALAHLDCAAAQVLLSFTSAMTRRGLQVTWTPLPDGPREYLALAGLLDEFSSALVPAGEF